MAELFQWSCPFCNHKQIVTAGNLHRGLQQLHIGKSEDGVVGIWWEAIRCVNHECNKVSLQVSLDKGVWRDGSFQSIKELRRWHLLPESFAKPQPDFIPKPLRDDYFEACLIRDKSPKASATLSRRALQGMIRDFCDIREKTLFKEIIELEKRVADGTAPRGVEEETIAAIHAVRKIGNIGAHMESDINVIVDVEPGEAQALIDLIELLFEDWYVARETRRAKLAKILAIDGVKEAAKAQPALAAPESDPNEGPV